MFLPNDTDIPLKTSDILFKIAKLLCLKIYVYVLSALKKIPTRYKNRSNKKFDENVGFIAANKTP